MNNKKTLQNLPDELLIIIRDFLTYKDRFYTNRQYFKIHLNYSLVCKSMYKIFILDSNKYLNLFLRESNELISRQRCILKYCVDINDLDYIYGNNTHRFFRDWVEIYNEVSVMEFCYKKYGTYYNYIKFDIEKEIENKMKEKGENI